MPTQCPQVHACEVLLIRPLAQNASLHWFESLSSIAEVTLGPHHVKDKLGRKSKMRSGARGAGGAPLRNMLPSSMTTPVSVPAFGSLHRLRIRAYIIWLRLFRLGALYGRRLCVSTLFLYDIPYAELQ